MTISRKYSLNEDYFSEPNLENCYWAGLLASDGNIDDYRKTVSHIRLTLNEKDVDALVKFKKALKCNAPLYYSKQYNAYTLNLYSVKMVDDLKKHFNITPRKSKTLLPPNITNEDLIKSYVIGYIDGDGGMQLVTRGPRVKINGSKFIMNWIKSYIDKWSPKTYKRVAQVTKDVGCYCYSIQGERAINLVRFLNLVDIPFKFQRKWSKFDYV